MYINKYYYISLCLLCACGVLGNVQATAEEVVIQKVKKQINTLFRGYQADKGRYINALTHKHNAKAILKEVKNKALAATEDEAKKQAIQAAYDYLIATKNDTAIEKWIATMERCVLMIGDNLPETDTFINDFFDLQQNKHQNYETRNLYQNNLEPEVYKNEENGTLYMRMISLVTGWWENVGMTSNEKVQLDSYRVDVIMKSLEEKNNILIQAVCLVFNSEKRIIAGKKKRNLWHFCGVVRTCFKKGWEKVIIRICFYCLLN